MGLCHQVYFSAWEEVKVSVSDLDGEINLLRDGTLENSVKM